MKALIVEHGMSRAALAAARGLAAAGWTVGVASPRERSLAAASRSVSHEHWVPDTSDPNGFVEGVRDIVVDHGYEVVFGADDAEVMLLCQHAGEIPAAVPYPDPESVALALDKVELGRLAEQAGIATPATADSPDGLALPMIVKGRMHAEGGASRQDASIERQMERVEARAEEIRESGGRPIFQELVTGSLVALVCLVGGDAEVLAAVQQQAELTVPAAAGVTVRGRTTAVNQALLRRVSELLRGLGWRGLAELQFIQPADGGEPRLIDLNGRFYGSLSLSMAAGVNMPAAWAALATGDDPGDLPAPRQGVRYQWLEGDLRRALYDRRGGLVRDVGSCLAYAPGATHSIWSWRDPRPGLRLFRILLGRGAGR
jgi:predicted ATP-grasp superfamily ATP-dependent carboligase